MAKKKKKKFKREINFKYNWKTFWSFLSKYKGRFLTVMLLSLIVEASFIIPKLLLKEVVDGGTEFANGALGLNIFVDMLLLFLLIYVATTVTRAVFHFVSHMLMEKLAGNMIYDLKERYFNHIINLSHNFHTTHKTGSLISRLMRGGNAIDNLTDVIVYNVSPLVFQIIVVGFSVIYFSPMSALVLVGTVLVFVTYSVWLQNLQKESNIIMNDTEDIEKGNIADFFTNIDSIKHFGKENQIKKMYSKLAWRTRITMINFWKYFRWMGAGQSFILSMGSLLMIIVPLMKFLDGEITLGTVVFIYSVYGNLVGPMFGFIHGVRAYYRAMADFDALFEYGKIENEIKDQPGAPNLKVVHGDVEFRNMTFSYTSKKAIFRNFNLKINRNEKVALVGHSGCGKTSLIKLLYRLYDVQEGAILVDGYDIREVKQGSLRSELSIVPQECVLFDDTIYNNIAFSKPGASKKEVFKAIKFAQLDKIIKEFPKKEKTIVGERGVRLSGGEKQRVSIARAILADKKILVLDEATSALDSQTEHEIQRDLEKLMQGRTSIIIAHRLSTIMKADKIVVMKRGKIIEMGNHKELLRKGGEYRHLWELQKGGFIK